MGACIICLDTSPPPIRSGCACRGDSALAHVHCLAQVAASQQAKRGNQIWKHCQTCQQEFTGAMRAGLAEVWRARVAGQAAESADRLAAEANLAEILLWDEHGKHVEAERRLRDLHKAHIRVFGTGHLETLAVQGNLAYSLSGQDKYPEAEAIVRELLGAYTRLLGAEHPLTLKAANHLGGCLSSQGKYAEAETFQRELLEVRKRVLGAAHASTLATASNLAEQQSE